MISDVNPHHPRIKSLRLKVIIGVALIAIFALPAGASRSVHARSGNHQTLTFEDRVAAQRAIEEVYWRHRIWPKENTRPKPLLDSVMPESALRAKVEDYLRKSNAFEVNRQRSLTGKELQAEIERMARQTRRPEVLRELWAALGNDPLVIAECLARPLLVDRLARERSPLNDLFQGELSSTGVPTSRSSHTAVWTGSEMIIWGGQDSSGSRYNSGGRYFPATDTWTSSTSMSVWVKEWILQMELPLLPT